MNPVQSTQLLNGWHVPSEGGRMANNLISVQLALLGSIIIIILPEYSSVLVFGFFFFPITFKKKSITSRRKKEGENCFFFQTVFLPIHNHK